MIRQLLRDESRRQQILTETNNWAILLPMEDMIPQLPYSRSHSDVAHHIDCGIYVILTTLVRLARHPLNILTPAQVHIFRKYIAHQLLLAPTSLNISTFLFRVKKARQRTPTNAPTTVRDSLTTTAQSKTSLPSSDHAIPTRLSTLRPQSQQKPSS